MMRKILYLAAAVVLLAVLPASAETAQPVTAEELGALLETVRAEALADEPLNDPADEEAQNEDGTLIQYETMRIYTAGGPLTETVPVNVLSFDDDGKPVFRGLGIFSSLEEVFAAFPNDNPELAGTREEAALYVRSTAEGGVAWGRVLRDGQRVDAVEYGEVLPAGNQFRRAAIVLLRSFAMEVVADGNLLRRHIS